MVLVLSASVEQSRVVFSYAKAFFESSPVLRQEIDSITRNEIRLKNGIVIAIHSNSFRTVRGVTLCAVVLDEVAVASATNPRLRPTQRSTRRSSQHSSRPAECWSAFRQATVESRAALHEIPRLFRPVI